MTERVLMIALAAGALLLVARTWRRGYEARSALGAGALGAAAVLTRNAALVLAPLIVLGALGPLWTRGAVARKYLAWCGQAAVAAAIVVGVWLAWTNWQ